MLSFKIAIKNTNLNKSKTTLHLPAAWC